MSTWDDKPNDYEHALQIIEQLRAAIWMALDNEDSIAVAEVRRVLNQQQPAASCIYEARTTDGSMYGVSAAWCRTHGFNCPNLGIQLIAKDTP